MKKILMTGNDALAEGAIQARCRFYAGYPITPQNEVSAYMAKRMPEVGGAFIQSESELAAINLVFGASAAGARAMTSSSGPGISLKQEGLSYIAACELPAVVANVMRGGPGLGNIAPAQGDYFQAVKGGGHGDYHQIVLAPSYVDEVMNLTSLAFDLADRYRNPVMILMDGLLGQMMEPVTVSGERSAVSANRKPQTESRKPWALTGCSGRKPNVIRSLLLENGALEKHNLQLQAKYMTVEKNEIMYEGMYHNSSDILLVAYGSVARICKAVVKEARKHNRRVGLLRPITLWPFPSKILQRLSSKLKAILVIEMSAGQMLEDVRLAVEGRCPVKFYGRMGGGIPTEEEILKKIYNITINQNLEH